MENQQPEIISFGKYKGRPVDFLQTDPAYCEWLLTQKWFVDRYPQINTLIVNNFTAAEDTPVHNMLQAKFLDDELCSSLCARVVRIEGSPFPEYVGKIRNYFQSKYSGCVRQYETEKERIKRAADNTFGCVNDIKKAKVPCVKGDYDNKYYSPETDNGYSKWNTPGPACYCSSAILDGGSVKIEKTEFEVEGWDVKINASIIAGDVSAMDDLNISCFVEIKPSLGDDYPSVLRQMKANLPYLSDKRLFVLVYKEFTASSVTEEQVKNIFARSGFSVTSFGELENLVC